MAHRLLEGLGSKERQQQGPVMLRGRQLVAAGIQEGFLEEVAMGLLSESELGRWKGRAFRAEGAASAKAWRPESRLRAKESASLPRTIADGSGEALNSLPKHCLRAEFECFQIELSKNYGMTEWRDDVKKVLLKAGLHNLPITFLFSDTQVPLHGQWAGSGVSGIPLTPACHPEW